MPESADLSRVRWLARRVLAPDPAGVTSHLPAPIMLRAHLRRSPAARAYVLWWIRNPEPGGTFERRTRGLRLLPGAFVLRLLLALGYDGLLYERERTIVGHLFFQRHGSTLHAFSTAVDEALGIAGASVVMMLDFVAYAAERPGITRARVGRGTNITTRRLNERIRPHGEALGWSVDADGWVTFRAAGSG